VALTPDPSRTTAQIEAVVREHWGYILATLTAQVRDLQVAEDVLQDAVVAALQRWPIDGTPDNPRAWLLRAARNRAIDLFRRDRRFEDRRETLIRDFESAQAQEPDSVENPVDERLSLMFTCCHPALAGPAQVALTLRTLGGLTTSAIARAFLTPETTMAQRIVRAKTKIKAARIPYRVPPPELWPERLQAVLSVVYFIYNEGYQSASGQTLQRLDLCEEAIRLSRILVELSPHEPEASGLLALMLLHHSRRQARTNDGEQLVILEEQDRSLWDQDEIRDGDRILREALARGRPGPYQLQAAISAVHALSPSHAETDWPQIVGLYRCLHDLQPSVVVRLNEIVALSFVEGPAAALEALTAIEDEDVLQRYQPFHAARADLFRRCGRRDEAAAAYRRALELSGNDAERSFMSRRLAELDEA